PSPFVSHRNYGGGFGEQPARKVIKTTIRTGEGSPRGCCRCSPRVCDRCAITPRSQCGICVFFGNLVLEANMLLFMGKSRNA
ncbi:unnamed protein product, partial [Ostreobium quekettii]